MEQFKSWIIQWIQGKNEMSMTNLKGFVKFRKILFTPRVIVFILTGIGVMLLTFLTQNNAFELGIAGIASVFIGIGVNNFTAIEAEKKDERRLHRKIQNTIKTLTQIQVKINKTQSFPKDHPEFLLIELQEMSVHIELCIDYLKEH